MVRLKTYVVKHKDKLTTVQAESKQQAEQGYYIYKQLHDIVNGKI